MSTRVTAPSAAQAEPPADRAAAAERAHELPPSAPATEAALPPGPRPRSPGAMLRHLGLHARKRLSQSFLTDRRVCATIARAAELDAADEVLEIGPGLGILTAELVQRAGRVVAVELDARLAAVLPGTLGHPANLTVVQADALAVDPSTLFSGDYKVVANLPYHVTSPLLTHLL